MMQNGLSTCLELTGRLNLPAIFLSSKRIASQNQVVYNYSKALFKSVFGFPKTA
ncbi:hypothetical protein X474_14070 [Dethiosulfatarculus sandiegensis]|uniref:Uncharacterized protein n=1 Tax=Dethiosulfatarculus sandiegensis TaxID=1429043 RepID=A0A0D2JV27_9BACT|nr:hypothetical protein X474_14070 [Dethiosulfatarculus sandiegensis]